MPHRALLLLIALFVTSTVTTPSVADDKSRAGRIRSQYTKFEYRIPMRDGTHLFTAVYIPNHPTKRYPILMSRTPYNVGPYGADKYRSRLGPTAKYEDDGFIFVFQDVRGCYMSEGTFVNMRPHIEGKTGTQVDESTDTYDTIEWLLANLKHHNGKVGQWGVSYPGFYCSAGMIDSHPALKAVSPQAPIADWFWDDMHHHGAFVLPLSYIFFSSFGRDRPGPTTARGKGINLGTPDGYRYFLDMGPVSNANAKGRLGGKIAFWNEMTKHPNYDAFWQSRNIIPHLKNIKAAVLVVGGWYDTEDLHGPLKTYAAIEANNPGIDNHLVMGPWSHGAWRGAGRNLGDQDFQFNTGDWFRDKIELPFFNHHLRGKGKPHIPEATVFETGANRWRRFDSWPPAQAKQAQIYIGPGGSLLFKAPTREADAADAYTSDPRRPVPYTGDITRGWSTGYMTEDQRFASRRPDVLVYETEILKEDLTLAGPIKANLWVSTTGTASDFVVKIIDVYPGKMSGYEKPSGTNDRGGQESLIRADVIRGRFRESYERPVPFTPGKITQVAFELSDVLHTFKRGHKVMIQIQSTWFPFIDRNPQTYVPNIFEAKASDFVTVTNRIHRSKAHPSHIQVGLLR